jgi:hypothetical protein
MPSGGEGKRSKRPFNSHLKGPAASRMRVRGCVYHVRLRQLTHSISYQVVCSARCGPVVAAVVVRVQKRARDGDDGKASQGRVVRACRGAEAGRASTPHQDGGGGILSGSGAV